MSSTEKTGCIWRECFYRVRTSDWVTGRFVFPCRVCRVLYSPVFRLGLSRIAVPGTPIRVTAPGGGVNSRRNTASLWREYVHRCQHKWRGLRGWCTLTGDNVSANEVHSRSAMRRVEFNCRDFDLRKEEGCYFTWWIVGDRSRLDAKTKVY